MIENIFILIGLILMIGYLGRITYQKTKIPESIFLIIIGLLIGPVFNLIQTDALMVFVPFISVLALTVVLFDCGLNFNVFQVFKRFNKALIFTFVVGVLSTALIGFTLYHFFQWQLLHALMLGLIASGTTTFTAMVLLKDLDIDFNTKHFLFLETVINDFTIIFGVSIILLVMGKQLVNGSNIANEIFSSISVAVILGILLGYIWIKMLEKVALPRLNYISSIGVLFFLYGLTETMGGAGLIAVLVFSMLIGNYPAIQKKFIEEEVVVEPTRKVIESIRHVQEDISFLVRVFFFVLIGAIFDFRSLTPLILTIVGIIILLILLVRFISSFLATIIDKTLTQYRFIIITMIPRGFVATVLAFIPLKEQIIIPSLTEIILLLILSTNILAMIFTFSYSHLVAPKIERQETAVKKKRYKKRK